MQADRDARSNSRGESRIQMQLILTLSSSTTWSVLRARLAEHLTLRKSTSEAFERTYYDTFDWRLYEAKELLLVDRDKSGYKVSVRKTDSHRLLPGCNATVDYFPRFAADLPVSALRNHLLRRSEIRALLAVTSMKIKRQVFAVLDEDRKTVARLLMEDLRIAGDSTRHGGAHLRRVWLRGLTGYESTFAQLRSDLLAEIEGQESDDREFEWAVAYASRTPGSTASRAALSLSADMPAAAAFKHIGLQLRAVMLENEDGVRKAIDTEFLHDYRVAVRKTRALLAQMKTVFPAVTIARYRKEFSWLGQITGRPRDVDVYLLSFDSYQASVPEALQAALEPLRAVLHKQQREAQKALVDTMETSRYRRLFQRWGQFLQRADVPPTGRSAILLVSQRRLRRLWRRVVKQGKAIGPDAAPEALHELRKSCKKLRYVFEFFRRLYSARTANPNLKILKALQSSLGEFQDTAVQIVALQANASAVVSNGLAPETLLSMGTLIGMLSERQAVARVQCMEDLGRFLSARSERTWYAMLAPTEDKD